MWPGNPASIIIGCTGNAHPGADSGKVPDGAKIPASKNGYGMCDVRVFPNAKVRRKVAELVYDGMVANL
jgi:hypothetical protein